MNIKLVIAGMFASAVAPAVTLLSIMAMGGPTNEIAFFGGLSAGCMFGFVLARLTR